MVMQPKVLILDEPTSQLDPIAAADFIATLKKLNNEFGITVLLVEHRLEDVFPIADKVLLMENGCVLLYDSPRAVGKILKNKSRAPYAQGSSECRKALQSALVGRSLPAYG